MEDLERAGGKPIADFYGEEVLDHQLGSGREAKYPNSWITSVSSRN